MLVFYSISRRGQGVVSGAKSDFRYFSFFVGLNVAVLLSKGKLVSASQV